MAKRIFGLKFFVALFGFFVTNCVYAQTLTVAGIVVNQIPNVDDHHMFKLGQNGVFEVMANVSHVLEIRVASDATKKIVIPCLSGSYLTGTGRSSEVYPFTHPKKGDFVEVEVKINDDKIVAKNQGNKLFLNHLTKAQIDTIKSLLK